MNEKTLGARIRRLRMIAGWEAKELAAKVGMSPAAISKIEHDTQGVSPAQFKAISEALAKSDALEPLGAATIREVMWGEKVLEMSTSDNNSYQAFPAFPLINRLPVAA